MMLDRLSGRGADPGLEAASPGAPRGSGPARPGSGPRTEPSPPADRKDGHDAVPRVLDLAARGRGQGVPDDPVVSAKQGHGRVVSEALGQRRRADDVREEDGADARVPLVAAPPGTRAAPARFVSTPPRNPSAISGWTSMIRSATRPCASRWTDAAASGLGRADETEDLAAALVEPVLDVLDAARPAASPCRRVGLRDVVRRGPVDLVDVHVQRHVRSPVRVQKTTSPQGCGGLIREVLLWGSRASDGAALTSRASENLPFPSLRWRNRRTFIPTFIISLFPGRHSR